MTILDTDTLPFFFTASGFSAGVCSGACTGVTFSVRSMLPLHTLFAAAEQDDGERRRDCEQHPAYDRSRRNGRRGELFVLEINVPITVENSVQLKYTVKLMNPKTAAGDYGQYDEDGSENYPGLYTNNSAVLYPVDSKGEIGEPESFPKPTVSYTVDNGNDNPGTDPTPDPDPDPDRPSRPNRDDDDDWEPLPDAPVKDKPTTEVDVPEETETPTTEQPDKYNPETGDTTTVFAAMALAAVSLGGVVLLGRKKK